MLRRKLLAGYPERLETRVLLAADLLSASPTAGRVELIKEAPETETVEVRSLVIESADFSIADAPRYVANRAEAPTRVATVSPAIVVSMAEPVAVKPTVRKLAATDGLRVVPTRFQDAVELTVAVFKPRTEPTVRLTNVEITKTIEKTPSDSSQDQAKESDQTDTPSDGSKEKPTELTARTGSRSPREVSDRETTVNQRREATDTATPEEVGSMALAASQPAGAPLHSTAAESSRVGGMSSQRSATPPVQVVPRESSGTSIAMPQAWSAGTHGVDQYEQLAMAEGAVFAVALGVPLVRFASAAAAPGDLNGSGVSASGASSMPRVRSRRRRGKERSTPIDVVDDLPSPLRAEPFAIRLTVAAELPLPTRGGASRRTILPRLADLLVAGLTAEPDMQTSSSDDRFEDERSGADESRTASSAQFSVVIAGGSVAAGTIAMLAYERVLRYRGDSTGNRKTCPVSNAVTRVRGDS